jgi:hypothetical protein
MNLIEVDEVVTSLARDLHDAVDDDTWFSLDHDARQRYEQLAITAIKWFRGELERAYDRGYDEGLEDGAEERDEELPAA